MIFSLGIWGCLSLNCQLLQTRLWALTWLISLSALYEYPHWALKEVPRQDTNEINNTISSIFNYSAKDLKFQGSSCRVLRGNKFTFLWKKWRCRIHSSIGWIFHLFLSFSFVILNYKNIKTLKCNCNPTVLIKRLTGNHKIISLPDGFKSY